MIMASSSVKRIGSSRSVQIYFAIFLLLASLTQSVAVPSRMRIDPHTGKFEEGTCDVKGNPDLYGLGVRLGIYFQWIGSYLSNILLPGEVSNNLDANSIFLLALFVAVAKGSFDDSIGSIDALVLLILAYGYFFSVLSLFGYRTRFLNDGKGVYISTMGTYLRLMLTSAISAFAVWFWFDGITELQQAPCDEVIFLFTMLDVQGPIRTAFKVASVFCLLYYGSLMLVAIVTLAKYIFKASGARRHDSELKFWETYRKAWMRHGQNPLDSRSIKFIFHVCRVFNVVYLLWAAITVELTLNGNNVRDTVGSGGLSSTGQQLPVLIGAFTMLRVLWLLWKEWRERKREALGFYEEDVDSIKMADLDKDGEDGPVSPTLPSHVMARTMGNTNTAYKPVPDATTAPLD